jgi:hypothetical protein
MAEPTMLSKLASTLGMGGQGMADKSYDTIKYDKAYKKYVSEEIAADREPLDKDSFIKKYGS